MVNDQGLELVDDFDQLEYELDDRDIHFNDQAWSNEDDENEFADSEDEWEDDGEEEEV